MIDEMRSSDGQRAAHGYDPSRNDAFATNRTNRSANTVYGQPHHGSRSPSPSLKKRRNNFRVVIR